MSIMNSFIVISSRKLPLKPPDSSDITRDTPSHQEKSRQLSDFFFQESLPSMPSLRVPRPLPNSPQTHENDLSCDIL